MGGSKDADMSPFEAGRKLLSLESERLSLNDRIDLVFQDADLVPLLVQVGITIVHLLHLQRIEVLFREGVCLVSGDLCRSLQASLTKLLCFSCRKITSTIGQRLPKAKLLA